MRFSPPSGSWLVAAALLGVGCTKTGDAAREPTAASDASSPAATAPMEAPISTGGGPVAPIAIRHDNADASVKAEKPSAAKCGTDGDCRLQSSYCQTTPCTCIVHAKGEPDTKCTSDRPVSCFVDPCMKKQAKCKGGVCTLFSETSSAEVRSQ